MHIDRRSRSLVAVLAISAASLAAADEPPAGPARYKSLVVSERPALPNSDGGSTVTLSSQDIERLPAGPDRPLSEVLLTQAGMHADAYGQVHVRGHYAHLLYRLDGVPLPPGLVDQLVALVPVRALQSLTLRTGGLQAAIGGQIGGVVDLELVDFVRPDGAASIRYDSFNTVVPSLVYGRTAGRFSFFVAGDYERTDRGLDSPAPAPIVHDEAQSGHALVHVTYHAGAQDLIRLDVAFVQAAFQIPLNPLRQRALDLYGNTPNPFIPLDANPTELERDVLATLSYRHALRGGGALQASLYFRHVEADLACDPARALGPTADPGASCSDVAHTLFHAGGVVDATRPVGARHVFQAGLWLDDQESDVRYRRYEAGAPTLSGDDETRTEYLGVYAQDQIRLGPVTLFPGVRFDLQNVGAAGNATTLLLYSPNARLGATWAWSRNWSLHAYAGYLWQPPSLDAPTAGRALGLIPAGQPVVYDLRAEGDWYGELGVTGRPLAGLVVSLTAWGRLMDNPIDDQEVGDTNLKAEYNYERGRAYGVELGGTFVFGAHLSGLANATLSRAEGQGIASARYLFTDAQLADAHWQPFDHDQTLTGNVAFDLHDRARRTHFSASVTYGSGLRTGPTNRWRLPAYESVDISFRHRFDFVGQPELALDVRNLFDDEYALRIGNGSLAGSAYGAGRRFGARITVPLPY